MIYIQFLKLHQGAIVNITDAIGTHELDGNQTMPQWKSIALDVVSLNGQLVVGYVIYKGSEVKDGNVELFRSDIPSKKFIVEIDVPLVTDKDEFQDDLTVAIREYGRSTSDKNTLSKASIIETHDQP